MPLGLIDGDGTLYTFGSGKHGQLGLGPGIVLAMSPTHVALPACQDGAAAASVDIQDPPPLALHLGLGSHHTCVVDSTGRAWTCGRNTFGQVSSPPSDERYWHWHSIAQWPVDDVISIHCGWTHTLVLLRQGEVWGWGRNRYGQLGRPDKHDTADAGDDNAVQRAFVPATVAVAVGTEHALCCTRFGDVYGFGWNEHGNVGDGTEADVHTPIRLPIACRPGVHVACGGGHSLVLIPAMTADDTP